MSTEFCVLDTEGTPTLREVAVVDERGQRIFEARTPRDDDSDYNQDGVRPLPDLLRELGDVLRDRRIVVAHKASHDRSVIEASFSSCSLNPPALQWECTWELAQKLHPGLDSYALGELCDQLRVGSKPFQRDAAHQAAYDARFTYHLFRHLQRDQLCQRLRDAKNPFSSSRVDTPFQHFADDRQVHDAAFQQLSAVLKSVARDTTNRQAQGAVLIGEPGAGKTHLMMRLAEEVLSSNRLLFIRQPNQADSVLFHIYSRTLESLMEEVGDGSHSQLDLLLIRSIRSILSAGDPSTKIEREILAALNAENLDRLGQEGSRNHRERWDRIETRLLNWWTYSGFGPQILRGLLRVFRYTDRRYRDSCRRWLATGEYEPVGQELEGLSPWSEEQRREEFSLQALQVIGRLCCLDKPLILVFDQLEGLWDEGNHPVLLKFWEAIKELFTHVPYALILNIFFPDRWQQFQHDFDGSIIDRVAQQVIQLESPRPDQIEKILNLRLKPLEATALDLFSSAELESITRQASIRKCLNRARAVFEHHVRQVPLPPPSPPPAVESHPKGGLVANQNFQQQWDHILQHLERLEKRVERLESGQTVSAGIDRTSSKSAASRQNLDRNEIFNTEVGLPAAGLREEPSGPESNGTAYEELFRPYRDSALDTLRRRWKQPRIIDGSDDAGKLNQIIRLGYKKIRPLELGNLRLRRSLRVPDNILIKTKEAQHCIAFLHMANGNSVRARLENLNQLVRIHTQVQFILMRDHSSPPIKSPTAKHALQAFLNGSGDGRCRTRQCPLDLERRVALEFVHQMVSDIINRKLDLPLPDALQILASHEPRNWIVMLLHPPLAA